MMAQAPTVLLLATFGLEVVECGALARNADAGGRSEAAVLLSRVESRPEVERAAEILSTKVRFLEKRYGEVAPDVEHKRRVVEVLRSVRPDIVITQDPEHSFEDLDPDRRPAMTLYLEALALAGRDWQVEACGGWAPHSARVVYYMTPRQPNCIIDVALAWERKQRALAELGSQLAFSGQTFRRLFGAGLRALLPEEASMDDTGVGLALHHHLDRAFHLYHGAGHHGRFLLAEPYRRQDLFHLDTLVV